MNYRMDCAVQMLNDPSIKIEQVANAVGYKNIASFSRIFKQIKGTTPTAYRAAMQEDPPK